MEDVCLIIKAPNQKYDDLKINCQLSWTILDLKIYLCKEYPSKPNISDQRLIHSGHLLKDEQSLRDIIQLSDDNDTYTFHLVCPQRAAASSPSSSSSSTRADGQSSPADGTNTAFSSAPLNNNSSAAASSIGESPATHHPGTSDTLEMRDSYNAMMSQYYQYMSYYYMASSASPPGVDYSAYYALANAYMRGANQNLPGFPNFNLANNANISNQNPAGANGDQQANGAAAAGNVNGQNAVNNANNNNQANNDNEEANRDWTDMLYSFSKAMVMFSIMYFYSSFGRLLLLITIAFILYLYKNARLNGVQNILNNNNNNNVEPENARVEQQPQAEQQQPLVNNNEANENENQESGPSDTVDGENNDNGTPNGAAPAENSRLTGLRFFWVFVSSLFTSLIPDPTPIN